MAWAPPPVALTRSNAADPAGEVVSFILNGDAEKDDDKVMDKLYFGIVMLHHSWRPRIQYRQNAIGLTVDQQRRLDRVIHFYERFRNNPRPPMALEDYEFGGKSKKSKRKSKKSAKKRKSKKKSLRKKRKSVKRKSL